MLRRGYTRETEIRRDRHGRWYEGGEPLANPAIERAFDGWIRRAPDGRLCLQNDIGWAYVEVEGPPYRVMSLTIDDACAQLLLSGEREELLDPDTLRLGVDDSLWCQVLDRSVAARFEAHATHQLADLIGEDDVGVFLELGERRVRPPLANDPLVWKDPAHDE